MQKKEVLLLLKDRWADWEASYAIAELNDMEGFAVRTIAEDARPKVSIGGLRAETDDTLAAYDDLSRLATLILPGKHGYSENRGLRDDTGSDRQAAAV